MELKEQAEEILEKLGQTFENEGLEFELVGIEGSTANLRARRLRPGVPVAFMVRAISGTFRRYLPAIEDVCLLEYDPGEEGARSTRSSPEFEKVLRHRPIMEAPAPQGIPTLNLSGLDRRQAVRAIEAFVKMWKQRAPRVRLRGVEEDAPGRAAARWADHYRPDFLRSQREQDFWTIYFREPTPEEAGIEEEEVMPGKVFLVEP